MTIQNSRDDVPTLLLLLFNFLNCLYSSERTICENLTKK